jgi:ribosomal-protein-alanine N-acetyltransferase
VNALAVDAASAPASLRPMREGDLDAVLAIEQRAYPFPWTRGIFRDCLRADYPAWVLVREGTVIGYGVLSIAAEEAHVLNVCTTPEVQGQCYGRRLLRALRRGLA